MREPSVIWINGPFGAGKTTLCDVLQDRLDRSYIFDPEYIGMVLGKLVPADHVDDFQDLPMWREATAHLLAHAVTTHPEVRFIVPMTVINPDYLREIFTGLQQRGVVVHHYFLTLERAELVRRITAQVIHEASPEHDEQVRQWRLARVDAGLAATAHLPAGTRVLDSEACSPSELANVVLAEVRG